MSPYMFCTIETQYCLLGSYKYWIVSSTDIKILKNELTPVTIEAN